MSNDSRLLQKESIPSTGAGVGGGLGNFGDLENDPELAQALRISMEEERNRQNEDNKNAAGEAPAANPDAGAA